MKTLNFLICKLYDNFTFGNIRPSIINLYFSKISISLIILLWFYVFVSFVRIRVNIGFENSFSWFYLILFLAIIYFINKNTWSLSKVEEFTNDMENEVTLNRMMWVFWTSLLLPTILLILIFKK
jgi:hypothetical protein